MYKITCDHCGKGFMRVETGLTLNEFIRQTQQEGWQIRPVPGLEGEDMFIVLCPSCQEAEDKEAGESSAEYALEIFFGLLIIYLLLSLLGIDLIHYLRVVLEFIGGGK